MLPTPDTRDRILNAARELFWQQGYNATGIAQILKSANANSGSLYYFFPTKEDLLLAVLQWYKANLHNEIIDPVFGRVSDPIERVFGVLDGYRRMLVMTHCAHGCPVGNLALEMADTHPAVRALCAENFSGWRDAIRGCLREAADRFPPSIDHDQLAAFVLTVMEGGLMQAKTYRSLDPFEAAVAQLREYFDRLLADGGNWTSMRKVARSVAEGDPN